jgi:hypothetical protein
MCVKTAVDYMEAHLQLRRRGEGLQIFKRGLFEASAGCVYGCSGERSRARQRPEAVVSGIPAAAKTRPDSGCKGMHRSDKRGVCVWVVRGERSRAVARCGCEWRTCSCGDVARVKSAQLSTCERVGSARLY